jgi:5-methylcytosine-specific restriction endonuclease McrA
MDYKKIAHKKTILVLNATYEPLHSTSWKRARILVYKEKAHVVSSRTIRLKNYVKVPQGKMTAGKPTRVLILKRDNHTCQYCEYSGPNLTIDHILPKSRGGQDTWQNLVASCYDCNNCKDNRTPEEWAAALKRVFDKETTNVSPLPFSWSSFQIGMLESRIRSRGTALSAKPKAPYNKITVTISTSEVDEWREYIYA